MCDYPAEYENRRGNRVLGSVRGTSQSAISRGGGKGDLMLCCAM